MKKVQCKIGKPHIALLLTGGGARAAYQVGVLKAIALSLPRSAPLPFKIINGTSAGAINSTGLACYSSNMHLAIRKIEWIWKNFHTNMVYKSTLLGAFGHLFNNVMRSFQADYLNHPPASLLDNTPLRVLLEEVLDLARIDRNIQRGFIDALSVTVSSYSSGKSVAFFQSKEAKPWQRAKREGIQTQLNIDHLMASSAIPMVFPSVRVKHNYYGDGSIHQLSPLSPSIHLGASKIFIIGVEQPKVQQPLGYEPHFPGMSVVAGHLLDSIFSDTLQSDLERLERVNRTLSLLPARDKHKELKRVDTLIVNPSHNFNELAIDFYDDLPIAVKLLLRTIGVKKHSQSSLTSYLLFEKSYTQELINIGYQDGLERLDEIKAFLELD
ncbi:MULTISPECIES: patatin-like phospholipase family protein [Pseudoalteromonas]|uniref:Patatin-like phospholipase family protein n=2 Tax=Pseudoalteromonas TaxID=53246 RepID=A0ABT7ETK7_9GAMM|nr:MULTISPECIES: patatin-like phospholipase family protein [Pseudoalteromonas]ESP90514.1 putative esterase of the alpha-beta hydrolase superfamily [Pseudoalteromonas luteoviolacea 2ta16]KZN41918.1 patatin [Pseudoalteromonas luteoviolacea NCIMB 1944]MBQ4837088.1 patatin-like phospholipase family protein [Pseudoalteromonas luteoviolacea]MCG7549780.1 patatin-like phospholipase family protein [Pseudoalteromonas sp. Of7M-16]MDK2598310.1 patatin-like phospholipase family protein [Pseudoalteromonas s